MYPSVKSVVIVELLNFKHAMYWRHIFLRTTWRLVLPGTSMTKDTAQNQWEIAFLSEFNERMSVIKGLNRPITDFVVSWHINSISP